jgi:hypothetical protein
MTPPGGISLLFFFKSDCVFFQKYEFRAAPVENRGSCGLLHGGGRRRHRGPLQLTRAERARGRRRRIAEERSRIAMLEDSDAEGPPLEEADPFQ